MGNTQTSGGADHDLYRRPADDVEQVRPKTQGSVSQRPSPHRPTEQDSVQIIEDGSVADAGAGRRAARTGGTSGAGHGADNWPNEGDAAAAGGRLPQSVPGWRGFNPYLVAAWAVVAPLLICGFGWLSGLLSASPEYYDPSFSQDRAMGDVIVMNLAGLGPIPFLFGLLGAFTLLTVQAAGFRRKS